MVFLSCASIRGGLMDGEVTVEVKNYRGESEYFRAAGSESSQKEAQFIEVGVIHQDPKTSAYLVELPMETDSGARRIWVPASAIVVNEPSFA